MVVSDIDEASVKDTAAHIAARGGVAHAYAVDVSDADAVEQFAERVSAEHGVPDIVVNNAGVGQAGLFLETPATNSTGCLRSISVESSTAAGRLAAASSIAAPAGTSSTSPRGRIFAAAVDECIPHTSKAAVFMFERLPARRTRSGRGRAHDGVPRRDQHEYRAHHPVRRARRKAGQGRGAARATGEGFRRKEIRSGQGGQGDRVRRQEEQADPARHPRKPASSTGLAPVAAGDAQLRRVPRKRRY